MLNKRIFLIILYFITTNSITKGDNTENIDQDPETNIVFINNDRKSNWFLNIGIGANLYFNNTGSSTPLRKRTTLNYNFAGGKWISPLLGLRLTVGGGKIHAPNVNDLEGINSITYINAHADVLFNFTNYVLPSLTRKYNIIPNAGIGYIRGDDNANLFKTKGFNGPSFNVGLLNTYRISNRVSAYLELGMSFVENRFDKQNYISNNNNDWNKIVNINAGISIILGKTGLKKVLLQDMSELDSLNNIINVLKEDANRRICHYPVPCPPVPNCPPNFSASNTFCAFPVNAVFFRINSSEVYDQQIFYDFSELLKNNKEMKLKLIGYADKDTGSDAYNLKLSKKRAENVASFLVDKHGIERDRLKVEHKGATEQPYRDKEWNRVVVLLVDYQ